MQIEHGVFFKIVDENAHVSLGDRTFVGCGSEFDISHELRIGANVLVAPGCFITDHNHGWRAGALIAEQPCNAGAVIIGSDVWLGAHVVVLPGVTIGDGAIVGAGAVVNRDVAAGTMVAGTPARPIGRRD